MAASHASVKAVNIVPWLKIVVPALITYVIGRFQEREKFRKNMAANESQKLVSLIRSVVDSSIENLTKTLSTEEHMKISATILTNIQRISQDLKQLASLTKKEIYYFNREYYNFHGAITGDYFAQPNMAPMEPSHVALSEIRRTETDLISKVRNSIK